jgi:hypothetical protein
LGTKRARAAASLAGLLTLMATQSALAQEGPERDEDWATVTTVTAVSAAGIQLLMPRIFYSDPEVTVGWKARWHVSVLAPVMTQFGLTMLNEYGLKESFEGPRPGCEGIGEPGCATYGMMSTHSYAAGAALGHGVGVFLFDTLTWSGGRFHGGAFAANVGAPLVLGAVTMVGRGAGNWETTEQILAGGGAGLALGFLTGMTYSLMQRPACGYSGAMICW